MNKTIVIKGLGGQGVKTLAGIIHRAISLDDENLHIAIGYEYDTVVRGGISDSHIFISDNKIINPVIDDSRDVDVVINARDSILSVKNAGIKDKLINEAVGLRAVHRGVFLVGVVASSGGAFIKSELLKKAVEEKFGEDSDNLEVLKKGMSINIESV